jgi:hypothetical protein
VIAKSSFLLFPLPSGGVWTGERGRVRGGRKKLLATKIFLTLHFRVMAIYGING